MPRPTVNYLPPASASELTESPSVRSQPTSPGGASTMDRLVAPTWADIDEARERYNEDAVRLRRWRWWFISMFTLYTTLTGILLVKIFTGV
jgi:hypothetical protein